MRNSQYIISAFLLLLLYSCSGKGTKGRQGNTGKHSIQIGNVQIATRLAPAQYSSEDTIAGKELTCFTVRIEKPGAAFDKAQMMYLNFDMQQDFQLNKGTDSLTSVFCQRIENGNPESFEYIVAFERPADTSVQDCTLLYRDKMFGIGTVAFAYDVNDIKKSNSKR